MLGHLTQELCRNQHSFHSTFAYHNTGIFQKKIVFAGVKAVEFQKNSKISEIIGVSQQLFTTPETKGKKDDSSDGNDDNSTVTPNTPKMNILFSNISDSKTGYYSGLEFMDKQDEFDKVFGKNPVLLPPNPTSINSSTTSKLLLDFNELCRLDLYLHAYRKFYVGNSKIDKNTSTQEIYREILDLRQEWKDKHVKLIVDDPEELFSKFLFLAGNLPNSAD